MNVYRRLICLFLLSLMLSLTAMCATAQEPQAEGVRPESEQSEGKSTEAAQPEAKQPKKPTTAEGPLPWETTRKHARLPGRRIANAKEYLELLGVDASQWKNLFNDQPLGPADEEWIDRVLYHLPRIGGENIAHWRRSNWKFEDVAADPEKSQGNVLQLRGRATQVKKIELLPELVDRYEYDHYYRVNIALNGQQFAVVCTRAIPAAWKDQSALDEPVEADGIFLKLSPQEDKPPQLVCAALRVAWLPDKVDTARGITAASVFLSQHGFDFGLWDSVHGRHMRGIQDADREPFYQLLAAMKNAEAQSQELTAAPSVDIVVAIGTPEQQVGSLVAVDGTVQRIDRVEVKDADIQARFGIDHYFTLYVFVPLHNQTIRWGRDHNDNNPRVFQNQFPVTVCVPDLPNGLKAAPILHEHVHMEGAFYKVWTYKPQGADSDLLQPSPLIIGPAVRLVADQPATDSSTNMIFGIAFVALIGAIWIFAWRMGRTERPLRRDVIEKKNLEVDLDKLPR